VRRCRSREERARVGRHRSLAGPRGTDCPHPSRSRDGKWSGFRGRDGEDAGVRSCSAVGQGECSRSHAGDVLTSYRCDVSRRVVADGTVSRECRTAGAPSENSDDDGKSATRLVLCLDCLPARIPHAGSSKGSTRARPFVSPRVPSETEHWSCRASMLGRSTRSAVVPADATSIAYSRDSRNPRFEFAKFVPTAPSPGSYPPRSRRFEGRNATSAATLAGPVYFSRMISSTPTDVAAALAAAVHD
jgi:hypothetical protein